VQFSAAFSNDTDLRAALNMSELDATYLRYNWIRMQMAYANLTNETWDGSDYGVPDSGPIDLSAVTSPVEQAALFTQKGLFWIVDQGIFDVYMLLGRYFAQNARGSLFREVEGMKLQLAFRAPQGKEWHIGSGAYIYRKNEINGEMSMRNRLGLVHTLLGLVSLGTGIYSLVNDWDTTSEDDKWLSGVRNVATALSLVGNFPHRFVKGSLGGFYQTIESRCALSLWESRLGEIYHPDAHFVSKGMRFFDDRKNMNPYAYALERMGFPERKSMDLKLYGYSEWFMDENTKLDSRTVRTKKGEVKYINGKGETITLPIKKTTVMLDSTEKWNAYERHAKTNGIKDLI